MDAHALIDEDVSALLWDDCAASRLTLYSRLIYSERYETAAVKALSNDSSLPALTANLIRNLDRGRLVQERMARLRTLSGALKRALPCLVALPRGRLAQEVRAFCDASSFWGRRGRSLAEHFTLSLSDSLRSTGDEFLAEIFQMWGTVSGISESPQSASPWSLNTHVLDNLPVNTIAAECMFTSWPMLDQNGFGPTTSNLKELYEFKHPHSIIIFAERDGQCRIVCERDQ